jgi:integrase
MTEQIMGYTTVDNWLGRLAPSTAKTNKVFLRKFMRWLAENGGQFSDHTPDQLVLYQKEAENSQQYDVLDVVQRYVGQLDLRENSKRREYAALRSLFAHNRAALPLDPTFRMRSKHTPVEGILRAEEVRDMLLSCNKVYRAVFLCMFQGALDLSGFDYWNRTGFDQLRQDLRGDPDLIKITFPNGRKMRRAPFFTLIGPDAIKALKDWLVVRPEDAEAIFTNQHGAPLNMHSAQLYWLRHLEKLGFIKRERNGKTSVRYGKNPHEMRDVFRSLWEKSPAKASVAEFMMGHVVDKLEYNKACRDEKWVRGEYRKALPMLQIMSSGRPFGQVEEDEIINLQEKVKDLEARLERSTRELYLERVEAQRDLAEHQEDISRVKTELKRLFAEVEILKDKPAHAAEI